MREDQRQKMAEQKDLAELAVEIGLHPRTYEILTALRENEAEFRKARDGAIKANHEHKSACILSTFARDIEAAFAQRALREWDEIKNSRLPGEAPDYVQFFPWLRARAAAGKGVG